MEAAGTSHEQAEHPEVKPEGIAAAAEATCEHEWND
jgi:hypothetical protein